MQAGLAINIRQLKILLGRCKSSINGSLQQIGFVSRPPGQSVDRELMRLIPLLVDDHMELKKWTIRRGECLAERTKEDPPVVEPREVVRCGFPCPAKCRHKLDDILQMCMPAQADLWPL
jgi:hypothetical protein